MTPAAELHAAAALIRDRAWAFPPWALALPDLLDHEGDMAARFYSHPESSAETFFSRELAVARAILGTDQRHSAQPETDAAANDQGTVTG